LHNLREFPVPIESIYPLHDLLVIKCDLHVGVDIGPDERVSALDILVQAGKSSLGEELKLLGDVLLVLLLKDLEQQGELGHLHRLCIYIHTINVVE